jgi:beta-lactamase class D
MHRRHFILSTLALGTLHLVRAEPSTLDMPTWATLFREAGVSGCIAVLDARGGAQTLRVADGARAQHRYAPVSTFKMPHSLFALDAGLLRDEFQVIPWDGVQRSIPAWNRDQTLRSAMRHSTVWVYERFARELGEVKMADYLRRIGYGNAQLGGAPPFWIEGDLAISALEQIAFLKRLYQNELPFSVAHQRLVKDVLVNAAGPDWLLRAKTGWSGRLGWWTGWMEWPEGPVYFALNMDTPNRLRDLPQRQALVRGALQTLGAWPESL